MRLTVLEKRAHHQRGQVKGNPPAGHGVHDLDVKQAVGHVRLGRDGNPPADEAPVAHRADHIVPVEHNIVPDLHVHGDGAEGGDGAQDAVEIGPDAAESLPGGVGKIQHHHVKAGAADVEEEAVVHHAAVDRAGGVREDELQRLPPVAGGADGLDEIVAGSRGHHAQRRAGMPQARGGLGQSAVPAEGDDRVRAPLRGLTGKLGRVVRMLSLIHI